jgi:hypothetical protein
MNTEQHLRAIIADLVFRVAVLNAELDTAREQLAKHAPVPEPEPK